MSAAINQDGLPSIISTRGAGKSPFRYPGGKAFLTAELQQAIAACEQKIIHYAEPFAGGAGAAIELLAAGTVQTIHLNDFDRRIYAVWHSILNRNAEFKSRLASTPVNIDQWYECRQTVTDADQIDDLFELGFATFFLNRTNRSGIILGSGPIGGYEQAGAWKLDARYYLDTMLTRISWLGQQAGRIKLSNLDAVDFIRSFNAKRSRQTFFFIDPPYVMAGSRLYLNTMNNEKHRKLASVLKNKSSVKNWLMTYDDCSLIRDIYKDRKISNFEVQYSLQKKRIENEVKITPIFSNCV